MAVPKIPQTTATSYKLFVKAADSQMVPLGQVLDIEAAESRDVNPNFVIGNDPPDQADGLIPGVVRNRTLRLRRVRLYAKGLRQAFGRDDQSVVASLTDLNTPVDLVATIKNPNDSKVKTITYKDGFLSDISGAVTMEGDIREIESATFVYLYPEETQFT